jgi:S-adenosylmethionine synthetase
METETVATISPDASPSKEKPTGAGMTTGQVMSAINTAMTQAVTLMAEQQRQALASTQASQQAAMQYMSQEIANYRLQVHQDVQGQLNQGSMAINQMIASNVRVPDDEEPL